MTLSDLWTSLEDHYDTLPPKLREAAGFVRAHPSESALHGRRRVARDSGLSPATLLRLVQTLGFAGWEEFQSLHRHWLVEAGSGIYSIRAGQTVAAGGEALIARIAAAEAANAASGLHPEQRESLLRAAERVAAAEAVAVLGLRSCHAVAHSMAYSLGLFHPGARLMAATGGLMLDEVAALPPGGMLIAISVAPYSRETVEATRHARDAGQGVVALTDAPLGAVARLADITLIAANEGPAHLASVTGLIALSQALVALALTHRGPQGLDALRRREAALAARSVFLPPEA